MELEEIGRTHQDRVLQSIPPQWRLEHEAYQELHDVTSVPNICGILTKSQLEITELSATSLVCRLESRELEAVQVVEAFAARTAIAHQLVNCLTEFFYEEGLKQAKELDELLDKGGKLKGPLHGVPIALKDYHCLNGHLSTFGQIGTRNYTPQQDSAIVTALRDAGAVFFCKTTMPQTGMALETVSNLWGRTLNPFDRRLSAGGSSGGDGVLVAMRGCPVAPSTDVGGSIRVPAAFNGLYALRPTADRIPKGRMDHTNTGQVSIKLSCGPVCHSVEDVPLLTKVINAYPSNKYDVTCTPVPWRQVEPLPDQLVFGIMEWDGVVMPHPPVRRTVKLVSKALQDAGHRVIPFKPPFDCWDASQLTFTAYYQAGAKAIIGSLKANGEDPIPVFADILKVYDTRELSATEILQLQMKIRILKEQFLDAWNDSAQLTGTGRPIDALICPVAPALGAPHDFNIYWGYTTLFNLVDYPSTVLPVKGFKVDSAHDAIDKEYQPVTTNSFDKPNHELYDPQTYINQPSTIQVVGRPFEDEELICISSILDSVLSA